MWSLFAFNLGVEIGQVAIILLLFSTLYLLRQTRLYLVGFKVASVGLMAVATIWALERIFEEDLKINKLIDPFVEVPRAYIFIALMTAAAAGWRRYENGRGRLRPVAATPADMSASPSDNDDREHVPA